MYVSVGKHETCLATPCDRRKCSLQSKVSRGYSSHKNNAWHLSSRCVQTQNDSNISKKLNFCAVQRLVLLHFCFAPAILFHFPLYIVIISISKISYPHYFLPGLNTSMTKSWLVLLNRNVGCSIYCRNNPITLNSHCKQFDLFVHHLLSTSE